MGDENSTAELEDAFSLVANDIRLDILQSLWNSYTEQASQDPDPVPFSTLKDRVGVRDSGQFHYHLDALVPQFVTHHEDGYMLTYAGARIVGAAISGVYTDTETTFQTSIDDACRNPSCQGTLGLQYQQGHALVECDSCELELVMSAPPILVGAHDIEANPELLGEFVTARLRQTVHGFCYLCNGPVTSRVAESYLDGDGAGENVKVAHECEECGAPSFTTATMTVLGHPAVVSLLHDAGIDYREIPSWRITQTLGAEETVRDDDPVRVEVTMTVDDDQLTILLDENLDVVESGKE